MKQDQFDNLIEPLVASGGVPQHVIEIRSKVLGELDDKILMAHTVISKFDKCKRPKALQMVQFSSLEKNKLDKVIKSADVTVVTLIMSQKMILGYLRLNDEEIDNEVDKRGLTVDKGSREASRVDKYTSKRPSLLQSSTVKNL